MNFYIFLAVVVFIVCAVETAIGNYQRNLKYIKKNQVGKLNELVNDIKNGGSCLFLKTTWDEIYEILCVDAKNGLSTLGTMSLLVGAFGFFSAFFLLWTQQTNGGHGPVQAGDDATKIAPEQQVEMQSVVATPASFDRSIYGQGGGTVNI